MILFDSWAMFPATVPASYSTPELSPCHYTDWIFLWPRVAMQTLRDNLLCVWATFAIQLVYSIFVLFNVSPFFRTFQCDLRRTCVVTGDRRASTHSTSRLQLTTHDHCSALAVITITITSERLSFIITRTFLRVRSQILAVTCQLATPRLPPLLT